MPTESKFHRAIRSFVRRGGRLTPSQAKALKNPAYLLKDTTLLDFKSIYNNEAPVILEIGFGMGHSLLTQAKRDTHLNFLGVEVHQPGIGALLAGIERESLTNLRVISADILHVLELIPSSSLEGVQLFFPDPWHKKRHHKRRLVQAEFIKRLGEKINTGGYLHCATDWENYAEHMLKVINASDAFNNSSSTQDFIPRPESRPITKFETRGLKLGHGVWDMRWIKKI